MYFAETFRSKQDLAGISQRFVVIDSTGRISLATAGSYAEGILENTPTPGDMPGVVSFLGITKITVDGAYPIGTFIVPTTNGVGTQATYITYPYVRGKLLEASDASGDIVTMRFIDEVVGSGLTGVMGPQGSTGVGYTGVAGATGLQGAVGQTGAFGQTGLQGAIGGTGVAGQTGVAGAVGETGVAGQTGVAGAVGGTGVAGAVGGTGVAGAVGGTGVAGQTGIQGETGLTGNTGVQGETGLMGNTGVQGETGI
jgi:hypothetical protein